MNPSSTAQLNTDVTGAMNQGAANQSMYNAQVPQLQSQYNQAQGQANQYGSQYSSFLNNLPQNYTNDMNQIGGMMGYNPQTTQNAAQGLTSAENIMGALPQAVNQMGNYSGATSGQIAQNYGNMAGNINQQVTNANNAMQNQLGMFGQMQTGAQNITGQQTTGYGQLYTTAVNQMQTAAQTMQQIESLQQSQGTATASQVASYNQAYQSYQQAQLAAAQIAEAAKATSGASGGTSGSSTPSSTPSSTAGSLGSALTGSNIAATLKNTNIGSDLSQWGGDLSKYGGSIGAGMVNPIQGASSLLGRLF